MDLPAPAVTAAPGSRAAAEPMPRELTARGLVLGSVLGILFAASSVYLSVKVGLTVSASIPVAVLSIAVFRVLGRSSVLENCMVQTTGSAGESLAFGVATALPALLLLGYDLDLVHAFLVALLGGVLGVLMMIPLRHGLVVQEKATLSFPEGTACAEVLEAGEHGGTTARMVISGFVIGAIYKVLYAALKLWREIIGGTLGSVERLGDGSVVRHGFPNASVQMEISPELLGVGYIIGPKVAGITFAGGVLSYLVLVPIIHFFGDGLTTPLALAGRHADPGHGPGRGAPQLRAVHRRRCGRRGRADQPHPLDAQHRPRLPAEPSELHRRAGWDGGGGAPHRAGSPDHRGHRWVGPAGVAGVAASPPASESGLRAAGGGGRLLLRHRQRPHHRRDR